MSHWFDGDHGVKYHIYGNQITKKKYDPIPYTKVTDLQKLQMRNRFLEASIKHIYSSLDVMSSSSILKEGLKEVLEFIDKNFM